MTVKTEATKTETVPVKHAAEPRMKGDLAHAFHPEDVRGLPRRDGGVLAGQKLAHVPALPELHREGDGDLAAFDRTSSAPTAI